MDQEEPRVVATRRGLHLDGNFIVSWDELDRVRALLDTIEEIPPIHKDTIRALINANHLSTESNQ